MDKSIASRTVSILSSVLLLLCVPLAQATTLTFDDLEFEGTSSAGLPSSLNYGGFNWDPNWSAGTTAKTGFSDTAQSGTGFLFNDGARHLTVSRDTPFDFLGAWFAAPVQLPTRAIRISAYGLDDLLLGSVGYLAFGTSPTWIDANFAGVSRLVIDPYGGTFTMDNFSFNDPLVALSEAGAWALISLGLLGLWAARRRGQQNA